MVVCDSDGNLLARFGDIERTFFIRSSAKPFQALASQESGADLTPRELAMASSSHRGHPVQIALVGSMLAEASLTEDDLKCPPSWPLADSAVRGVVASGATEPRRIWHNCSGKHAGFLRACRGSGWDTGSYLDPGHPLQRRVVDVVEEFGRHPVEPVGVDGCGAPVLRTSVGAMARMYAGLASDPRLGAVYSAMSTYPGLVGGTGEGDTEIAIAVDAAAKGGAAGCIGVALAGQGSVAVKSWDGRHEIAYLAAIEALRQVGMIGDTVLSVLSDVAFPVVHGGGRRVGRVEPVFELTS